MGVSSNTLEVDESDEEHEPPEHTIEERIRIALFEMLTGGGFTPDEFSDPDVLADVVLQFVTRRPAALIEYICNEEGEEDEEDEEAKRAPGTKWPGVRRSLGVDD